jgi:uncharacterized protein with HEPN domain
LKPQPAPLVDLLARIVSAIDEIFAFTEDMDESAFHGDRGTQLAVAFNIVAVGEASRSVLRRYPEFVTQHPEIEFAFANSMRNVLAHEYFRIDWEVVWASLREDLPEMRAAVQAVLGADGQSDHAE